MTCAIPTRTSSGTTTTTVPRCTGPTTATPRQQANERGRARIETLLLGDAASLEPYGLGPVRTVAEYEA